MILAEEPASKLFRKLFYLPNRIRYVSTTNVTKCVSLAPGLRDRDLSDVHVTYRRDADVPEETSGIYREHVKISKSNNETR